MKLKYIRNGTFKQLQKLIDLQLQNNQIDEYEIKKVNSFTYEQRSRRSS